MPDRFHARRFTSRILRRIQQGQYIPLSVILCIIATVLLTLVTLSCPIIENVFFLRLNFDRGSSEFAERYGLWGYTVTTGSRIKVGYAFPGYVVETSLYRHLTKLFFLHPISAVLAALASTNRRYVVIASIITLVVWISDYTLFTRVRDLYRDRKIVAEYGNGLWLTLGAFLALVLSLCTSERRREESDMYGRNRYRDRRPDSVARWQD
ncbi:hypothetical protein D9758_001781 [Tetrapyrgos nigripes]|uniref:Uncharacterized protein n=1 Tax=Tetrapyrgos nigripes TaxID=182062 RepID=A0A8H5GXL6_9AGAR|nr:hypothetical protein D9758_001781 [Tetrapyrgos nigripes]